MRVPKRVSGLYSIRISRHVIKLLLLLNYADISYSRLA